MSNDHARRSSRPGGPPSPEHGSPRSARSAPRPRPSPAAVRLGVAGFLALALAACGGGSGDSAPAPAPPGGPGDGSSPTAPGTPPAGPGGAPGGGARDTAGADLSRTGTPVPRNAVDPTTLPLVSNAGRARAAGLPGLGVVYEITENQGGDSDVACTTDVGAQYGSCSIANLHVADPNGELANGAWQLWFHSLRRILRVDSDEFTLTHVNGDLYRLEPADGFTGIASGPDGAVTSVRLVNEFSMRVESDFLPRYWLVRDGQEPRLLPNTDEETDESRYAMPITGDNRNEYNGDPRVVATPATRFADNAGTASRAAGLDARAVQSRIVPTPREIAVGAGDLNIAGGFSFAGTELSAGAVAALEARQATFAPQGAAVPLTATLDPSLAPGTHTLDVTASGIRVAGHDDEALFHGAQSLLGLVRPGTPTIPTVSIVDGPRFAHRGMHADVARNFHDVATIERLLDQMAAYKLNVLHLHLSDDEGWRLEIPALPELTSVGGRRAFARDADGALSEADGLMPLFGSGPFDTNRGSGHFSRADFVRLLRHATARHVRVVPEFDMPGHARAAVVAMRARAANLGTPTSTDVRIDDPDDASRYLTVQYYDDGILNPCVPGTYAFIETVVGEVRAMYDEAGAPLDAWHMGGDEALNVYRGPGYGPPFYDAFDASDWDLPWARSPACEAYVRATAGVDSRDDLERHFVERVSAIVANAGIPTLYAWHEIVETIPSEALATTGSGVTYWGSVTRGRSTVEALNGFAGLGHEIVLSAPDFLYFDFPEEIHPEERGQYWATRATSVEKLFAFAPENLPQNAERSGRQRRAGLDGTGRGLATAARRPAGAALDGADEDARAVRLHGLSAPARPRRARLAPRAPGSSTTTRRRRSRAAAVSSTRTRSTPTTRRSPPPSDRRNCRSSTPRASPTASPSPARRRRTARST